MGLDTIIRSAVTTAARVTSALQCQVVHQPYLSQNAYGEVAYDEAVMRRAVVEWRQRRIVTADGQEVLSTATVMFLGDVAVTTKDRITVTFEADEVVAWQDNVACVGAINSPILAVTGMIDPTTGRPYATVVYLGAG
jgi:hypothetical protein